MTVQFIKRLESLGFTVEILDHKKKSNGFCNHYTTEIKISDVIEHDYLFGLINEINDENLSYWISFKNENYIINEVI